MDMTLEEWKKCTLTEENVLAVYKECLPTEMTECPISVRLYQKLLCGVDSSIITFDHKKILENLVIISFMFGQLKAVHDGLSFMTPTQGFFDYTGEQWTKNQSALFALYHLGLVQDIFSPFVKTKDGLYADIRDIAITYPYDHPKFRESFANYKKLNEK